MVAAFAGMVRRIGALVPSVGGAIGILILGPEGGRWRLDLSVEGGGLRALAAGEASEVSTLIAASPRAFVQMWLHPDRIARFQEMGELRIEGDRSRLTELARLLKSGGSSVAIRAKEGARRRRDRG